MTGITVQGLDSQLMEFYSLENRKAERADLAFAQVLNLVDNWSSLDAQAKTYYGLMAAKVWYCPPQTSL